MHSDEERVTVRRNTPASFAPASLDGTDVAELRSYIAALQNEIARAEAAIAQRNSHRGAAEAFFRKP